MSIDPTPNTTITLRVYRLPPGPVPTLTARTLPTPSSGTDSGGTHDLRDANARPGRWPDGPFPPGPRLRRNQRERASQFLEWVFRHHMHLQGYADRSPMIWEDEDGHTVMWAIRQVVQTLTQREGIILMARWGFRDGFPWTNSELGRRFGITVSRIGQIENRILRKLRHPARAKWLRPFLYEYTDADGDAAFARQELERLLMEVYPSELSHDLAMRLRRRYLPDALVAVKGDSFRQLGRLVAFSCSFQLGVCALCGDPALPSSNWCLVHLNLKNQIVVVCDGCGIKFARHASQLLGFSRRTGRTQHAVFHDKRCFWKHGTRLGVYNQRAVNRVHAR